MFGGIVIDDTDLFNDKLQEWGATTTSTVPTVPLTARPPPWKIEIENHPTLMSTAYVSRTAKGDTGLRGIAVRSRRIWELGSAFDTKSI